MFYLKTFFEECSEERQKSEKHHSLTNKGKTFQEGVVFQYLPFTEKIGPAAYYFKSSDDFNI